MGNSLKKCPANLKWNKIMHKMVQWALNWVFSILKHRGTFLSMNNNRSGSNKHLLLLCLNFFVKLLLQFRISFFSNSDLGLHLTLILTVTNLISSFLSLTVKCHMLLQWRTTAEIRWHRFWVYLLLHRLLKVIFALN